MFTPLIKFIRILSSETDPLQISLGFSLAMIIGFTPLFSLHNILVIFFLLFFRTNVSTFLLSWVFFSGIAYLLDPVFHDLGKTVLTNTELTAFWTELYNQPFWRLSNFNNTVLMGGLLVSLTAFIPLLIISNYLIKRYRTHVLRYMQNSRIFHVIQSSKWFSRAVSLSEQDR